MAPWLPRMHLFEIHDQPWFHPWFRAKVQAALTETWTMQLPLLQPRGSPASIVAKVLADELGARIGEYVFVDYCAGAGGPTPSIERYINSSSSKTQPPVHFVLTDLHPHLPSWTRAAAASPQMHFSPRPVDAAASPPDLLAAAVPALPGASSSAAAPNNNNNNTNNKQKTFRTFHLAFHHLPAPLAAAALRDALAASAGFAVVELQDRRARSFAAVALLGLAALALAPYFAWRWRSPATLFWSWAVPVLPLVLVWDGWVSSLRTRTAGEVEALMARSGGLERGWRVRAGTAVHLPPFAELNWIIATKEEG